MTTLPNRNTLASIGATYGQVRVALGDMRDMISEALGNSGQSPVLTNASIVNASRVGVRTSTPGADLQVVGGLAVTASGAAATNPGDGSLYLDGTLKFANTEGTKFSFPSVTGNPGELGLQAANIFYRAKASFGHVFYSGGIYSATAFDAGTGGVELLRLNSSEFKYKGNTIYHSGNGVFLRKDTNDTASGNISFVAGATLSSSILTMAGTSTLNWSVVDLGCRIKLYSSTEDYSMGIQPSTLYFRSASTFAFYRGGLFSSSAAPAPGTGGETLLFLSSSALQYKGQDIYHTGNSNFVPKVSSARPGVTMLYFANEDTPGNIRADFNGYGDNRTRISSSGGNGAGLEVRVDVATYAFASANDGRRLLTWESNTRAGSVRLYRCDADEASYLQTYWDGSRYYIESKYPNGQSGEVRVARADNAGYADNSNWSNRTGGIHGNAIDDGTVRYWEISRAEATASNTGRFGVHDFAFGSPATNLGTDFYVVMGNVGSAGDQRAWSVLRTNGAGSFGNYFVRWQYITASGDPYTWVVTDQSDSVVASWDAEDPYDREFPESNPMFTIDGSEAKATLVKLPTAEEITQIINTQLDKSSLPTWLAKHKHKGAKNPKKLFRAFLKEYGGVREGMKEIKDDEDLDLNTFVLDLGGDEQKKNWRKQAIIRSAAKVLISSPTASVHEVLQKYYKVNKRGNLVLK